MARNKDVLTTGEVARICKVAPRTVTKWFDSGQLRGYRIPGSKDRRTLLKTLGVKHVFDSRTAAFADEIRAVTRGEGVDVVLNSLSGELMQQSLKLMRGPAQLAGLGALQGFLESGFDTFKAMRGAGEFLSTVRQREDTLARGLFQSDTSVLGQLP